MLLFHHSSHLLVYSLVAIPRWWCEIVINCYITFYQRIVRGQLEAGFIRGQLEAGFIRGQLEAGFIRGQLEAGFIRGQLEAGFIRGQLEGFIRWLHPRAA